MSKNRKPDNTSELYAVEEILREEVSKVKRNCYEGFWQIDMICPCCKHPLSIEVDSILKANYQYCRICLWESIVYFVEENRE